MRIQNLLFSAVQFLLVLTISCAGLFFLVLPWAPHVRFKCATFLAERDDLFLPLGALLLAIGLVLGIGFYFLQRRAYFQVKMDPSIYVEKEVLQKLLAIYWKKRFPEEKLNTDIILHKQNIELIAELPLVHEPKKLLKEIEAEISQLLVQQLGYKKEFFFTFQLK